MIAGSKYKSFSRVSAGVSLAVLGGLLAGCATGPGEATLAEVGGERITVAEFQAAARSHPIYALNPAPEAKRLLVEELVDRALLVAEARERGFDDHESYRSMTAETREQLLTDALYRDRIAEPIWVSEPELRSIWERQDEEWRISQIFAFSAPEIDAARRRLVAGEAFDAVARSTSVEPGAETAGGDVGFILPGQLPSAVEAVVQDLEVGEWGGPVATPSGHYLVLKSDRRERVRPPFEQAAPAIESQLRRRKERALVLDYVAGIKRRHGVEAVPASFAILAQRWQNRTLDEISASGGDLAALGFSEAELELPLVRHDGGAYRVRDLFAELESTPVISRPPSSNDPLLRLYVEDRVISELLVQEAERRGLAEREDVKRSLRERQESYLINRIYEEVVVPSARLTEEEIREIRRGGSIEGGNEGQYPSDPAAREALRFEEKRQDALQALLDRLRERNPPMIDEDVLAGVPWPVPPEGRA